MRKDYRCRLREPEHGSRGKESALTGFAILFEYSKPDAEFRISPGRLVNAQLNRIKAEYECQVFEFAKLTLVGVSLSILDDFKVDARGARELPTRHAQVLALPPKRLLDRAPASQ